MSAVPASSAELRVGAKAVDSASGGYLNMCGGIQGFHTNVDLMFCTTVRDGRESLDIAAVVRRSTDLPPRPLDPSYLNPPLGVLRSGGATVGPWYVSFHLPQRTLLVNGIAVTTLEDGQNVAMLVEEDGALALAGVESVNSDLGPPFLDPTTLMPTGLSICERMRESLLKASKVKNFIEHYSS